MGNGRSFARQLKAAEAPTEGVQTVPGVAAPVGPSPVPMSANLNQFRAPDGSIGVVMEISTPVGVAVYFLTPEGAKGIGEQLVAMGTAGAAGLVVPA